MHAHHTAAPHAPDSLVPDVFARRAAASPGEPAVVGEERLTYAELDHRATVLASALGEMGAGPGALVGVLLPRSARTVVALLAVLKTGAAYLPLDPQDPPARLTTLLRAARPWLVLCEPGSVGRLEHWGGARVLLGGPGGSPVQAPAAAVEPPHDLLPRDTAYVMFTSGSTGQPKGVVIPHRGILRLVRGADYVRFGPPEVFLHAAPLTFDASTFEVWGALLAGSRLVVAPHGPLALRDLAALIAGHGVTTAWLPAALLSVVAHQRIGLLAGVRQLVTGGDVVPVAAARAVCEAYPGIRLVNGYGPTESTTFACCHVVEAGDLEAVSLPIGRPIAGTQVYVLGEDGRQAPAGTPGEIFIGGDGLAAGYLYRPDLTRERFREQDVGDGVRRRLYRTGDLAHRRPDGVLVFHGRRDRQVKVRGHRVEPAEVDAALVTHPGVFQAVTVGVGDRTAGHRLASYYVPATRAAPAPEDLRRHLETRLPAYLVPAFVVRLDELPLTANGKVDTGALPDPLEGTAVGPGAAPALAGPALEGTSPDAVERRLGAWWRELLGHDPDGPGAHFFDQGGDSLRAVLLCSVIEEELGATLPVSTVYSCPTIGGLAAAVRQAGGEPWAPLVEMRPGHHPPLFLVHGLSGDVGGLWVLARHLPPGRPAFGFQARQACEDDEVEIEVMARAYTGEIERVQPGGTVRLAGYSAGGVVAFEMAHRLRRLGREVRLVLLNTEAPCLLRGEVPARLRFAPQAVLDLLHLAPSALRVRRGQGGEAPRGPPLQSSYLQRRMRFMVAFYTSLLRYEPVPLDIRVDLLRARRQPRDSPHDRTMGWRDSAAGRLRVSAVGGSTTTMLAEPHARRLAARVQRVLDRP